LFYLLYLLHLLRISFIISFKIRGFESIYYDEMKEMKEIFGDNKIMYQFSEVIDTGILRMFLKSKTSVETCDSGGRG